MPMIDVYAATGTFSDPRKLAQELASTLMAIEQVPGIPMFRKNTAAFVHDLPADHISNVDGEDTYVRVQVLTRAWSRPCAMKATRVWCTRRPPPAWGRC